MSRELFDSMVEDRERVTGTMIMRLVQEQEYRCALSGIKLTPKTASIDHKIPLSKGGLHRMDNAQIVHAEVNRAKGVLTNDEFIALCRRIVEWHDSRIDGESFDMPNGYQVGSFGEEEYIYDHLWVGVLPGR